MGGLLEYIKKLFENSALTAISMVVSTVASFAYRFLFPEKQYLYGAGAVLVIMVLDLATKMFSLSRQGGGFRKSLAEKKISSKAFSRGTFDKLLVFGIMMIICSCAYRLTIIDAIAVWFTQLVYTLMFLRDLLSILENLNDAGVGGLKIFQKAVKKKMGEYVDDDGEELKWNLVGMYLQ